MARIRRWAAVLTFCTVALVAMQPGDSLRSQAGRVQTPAGRARGSALPSDCIPAGLIDIIHSPTFEGLLKADAILHVRIAERGNWRELKYQGPCEILNEAPATVLRTVPLAGAPSNRMTTVRAWSNEAPLNGPLQAGSEYVVFHQQGWPADDVFIEPDYSLPVIDGRVLGVYEERLGIDNGAAFDHVLVRLQQTYRRHTQYRKYDDLTSAATFETLRYKTGWIEIGVMDSQLQKWTGGQPFSFERGPNGRELPRPGDRILLKASHPIYILDFGSHGEELRTQAPATDRRMDLADETGTRASPRVPYTVADVQSRLWGQDSWSVWIRLIAK